MKDTNEIVLLNPQVEEVEQVIKMESPMVKIQNEFDYEKLEQAYKEFHDKVPENEDEYKDLKAAIKSISPMKAKINDKRLEIVRPVNAALKELKEHGDNMIGIVDQVVTKLKKNATEYEEKKAMEARKPIDDAIEDMNTFFLKVTEEIRTCRFVDDIQYLQEQVDKYVPAVEEPEVTTLLMTRKNEALGKLMKKQQDIINEKLQSNSTSEPDEPKPHQPGVESKEEDSEQEAPQNVYEGLYNLFHLGRYTPYSMELNKLPKDQIYLYLRHCITSRPNLDPTQVVELLSFLK